MVSVALHFQNDPHQCNDGNMVGCNVPVTLFVSCCFKTESEEINAHISSSSLL